ncbi:two component transcriptional regulator, winged helix family [Desulfotomaculum nigrificans CO-1-SRB]|uniref:Stage 0 sporulation protein A homolog n=1 Tax=Desulfotomaculum nigrificans (strain DSM 14880 / VKM B-2319 / CO-1-SRB) TaxID=868595 RepID=F6B3B0_DESCC|nr:response regulator transcription factor [Desulfotomaculum nigrificans]AEF95141.1 two component transcriptional regulator, winged helix family [Desulfotomaculum nigrificans CO-1-SRB]
MPKILVVDDEQPIRELVKYNLEREGFEVLLAGDGNTGLDMARTEAPDLIILDIMLPGMDGLSVCRTLHQEPATRAIPIIMLSARGEEVDKVLGLELGADDYITKPFSPRELIARVKARLRRQTTDNAIQETGRIAVGKLIIDQDRFVVSVNGVKQDLTPKEFELLRYLARHPGKVFSRDLLLEQIWGYEYTGDSRTVDVHIRHIRQKLEQIPGAPQFIETVRGVGYRFKEG